MANPTTLSMLAARAMAMLGLFNGNRDLYRAFGWKRNPTARDFIDKYKHQDIAQRVIDTPVEALWADPPKLLGDDAFNKAWNDILAQIPVFAVIQRLDKLAGLGRYAVMVIGFDDGGKLDTPVRPGKGRKVIFLQPYHELSVEIEDYETDNTSPRFGMPKMYKIDPGKFELEERTVTQKVSALSSFRVHHSRIIHVAERALESPIIGQSRLEPVYNVLDDMQKVSGGSAETYWLTANRGLHADVDKDMELDPEDETALSEEMKEYEHGLRRIIRTRGVTVKSLGSEVADPRGVFDVQLSLLASNTKIPKRVLAGSEAGQLASQQDRANWAIACQERIASYGAPVVMIPFVRTLIHAGALPSPNNLVIDWPDSFKMNPLERAQTSAQMARSAANVMKALETQENINQSMATAALETEVVEPGFDKGGGFFGNADPKEKGSTKMDVTKDVNADPKPLPTVTKPPLMPKRAPIFVLSDEDARNIIGFGKHAPIFDEKTDTAAVGGTESGTDV